MEPQLAAVNEHPVAWQRLFRVGRLLSFCVLGALGLHSLSKQLYGGSSLLPFLSLGGVVFVGGLAYEGYGAYKERSLQAPVPQALEAVKVSEPPAEVKTIPPRSVPLATPQQEAAPPGHVATATRKLVALGAMLATAVAYPFVKVAKKLGQRSPAGQQPPRRLLATRNSRA